MQVVKIYNCRAAKFYAAHFVGRCARASMVPWPDYEKMFCTRFRRSVREMIAIKGQCLELVAVVLTGNRQNWQRDFLKLLASWHHRVVIRVGRGMFEDALEIRGRIADKRIESLEGDMFLVGIQKFAAPELLIAGKILLSGTAAGESEPLQVIGFAHVINRDSQRERRMRGRDGDNRSKMRRQFFRSRPLIKSCVRSAPHGDFTVAEWLAREPLDCIVTVALSCANGSNSPPELPRPRTSTSANTYPCDAK